MKTGAILRLTSFLCTVFTFTLLTGCGGEGGGSDVSTKVEQYAIETEDKFNVAPGADPSVSAEDGGTGFEEIAEDQGWKTNKLNDDQIKLVVDPNACRR